MNGKNLNLYNIQTIFLSTPEGGNGIRFSITIYRHVIIHAQCQQVAHWHSKIWKTWHRETEGEKGERVFWEGGEKIQNKRNITACFWLLWQQRFEKERGRGDTEGQIRHHNNTHAGQQKSVSISLAQKSMYGCNFMFFFFFFLFLSSSSSSSSSSISSLLTSSNIVL